ncbi:MAG: GtrA family protein [Candidatus Faecousia sp.]|nr:GtrA family protein [Candidatus Faecousia sp.]
MKKLWNWAMGLIKNNSLVRFMIVGGINTLVGTGTMFLLYNCIPWSVPEGSSLPYWVSTAANYVVGSIVSFFLNKYFTFRAKEWSWGQVWRFIVNILFCYGIAYGIAKPLVRMALRSAGQSLQDNAAMVVGMVLFVFLNYFGQRFFAFREKESGR